MDTDLLRALLSQLKSGDTSIEDAMEALKALPFEQLEHATVDHHRSVRQGTPEVIFGGKKSAAQIVSIAQSLLRAGENVLVTRIDKARADEVAVSLPNFRFNEVASVGAIRIKDVHRFAGSPIAVVTAGTSDVSVAEEAIETLDALGFDSERVYDVGVAGLHRLLGRLPDLRRAAAVIVLAGMEGALPSVVGGLIEAPVIAVPTSVGYGAALGGFTALFGMLTSCANGVVVVNIDSGFGAAMAVHRLLRGGRAAVEEQRV